MMASFPPGMAPGHPSMASHVHPMAGMQHGGNPHMGGPGGQAMMQGMHPGVSGPQVTQSPMVSGMPQGPGTPAPGGPMQNPMAMAHLGPQQHMYQQQGNPQMFGNMPMNQQQAQMFRHQQQMMKIAQVQQQQGVPMGMPNGMQQFNPAQIAQMRMNMPMQQQMNMQAHQVQQNQMAAHQQAQLMQARQAQHLAAQNQQRQQASQAQQMQLSRSQEQPTTQAPQPHPTPTPQNQPQPQSQPTPQSQPPTSQPTKAPTQPQAANNQQQNQPTPQIKQSENEDEPQVKQDGANQTFMQDIPKEQIIQAQQLQQQSAILRLISFQDTLANPTQPQDLSYWDGIIASAFSPFATLNQQLIVPDNGSQRSVGLQYASLARYFCMHYVNGVKQMLLQSYEHRPGMLRTGDFSVQSALASLTYVYHNDVHIVCQGTLSVIFDADMKITKMDIVTQSWTEYLPRSILQPASPDQTKDVRNRNSKKNQQTQATNTVACMAPNRSVGVYGIPYKIFAWLELADVMNQMAPLIEYSHEQVGIVPREAILRYNIEQAQTMTMNQNRMQNQIARQLNGQVQFPPGVNGPNQFASPAMAHLGIPNAQGSPHMGGSTHSPSPAHNAVGGVAMMHQMSAQGSNLSGSQGPSTNTSPNVTQKRRRPSQIKMEEENGGQNADNSAKVKPSPRMTNKRQKGS